MLFIGWKHRLLRSPFGCILLSGRWLRHALPKIHHNSLGDTRDKPRVYFFKDGLMSRSTAYFTSMRQPMFDTSYHKSQVYVSDRKIRKLFRPRENGQKRQMWSVLPTYIRFLLFLQSICSRYKLATLVPSVWVYLGNSNQIHFTQCLDPSE